MKLIQSFLMGKKRKGRGKKHLGKRKSTVSSFQANWKEKGKDKENIYVFIYMRKDFSSKDSAHGGRRVRWCKVIPAGISPLSLKTRGELCDTHIVQLFVSRLWFEGRWYLLKVQWAVKPEAAWEWVLHLFQCFTPQNPFSGAEKQDDLLEWTCFSPFSYYIFNTDSR